MNINGDDVTLTRAEAESLYRLALIGDAVQTLVTTTAQLGHARPGNSLDYTDPGEPGSAQAFVRDFTAWASGRTNMAPGCEDRLREWGIEEAALRLTRIGSLMSRAAS